MMRPVFLVAEGMRTSCFSEELSLVTQGLSLGREYGQPSCAGRALAAVMGLGSGVVLVARGAAA